MKILLLTGNKRRHQYFANRILNRFGDSNVDCIQEEKVARNDSSPKIVKHFHEQEDWEEFYFPNSSVIRTTGFHLIVPAGHINLSEKAKDLRRSADVIVVFGTSLIKDIPKNIPSLNLHLGISPYYKGAGTNFWPWVNNELEYVGYTIHHLSDKVDAGDIIKQGKAKISKGDNVHTLGCKTIISATIGMIQVLELIEKGLPVPSVPQKPCERTRIYKKADFNEEVLERYQDNLKNGIVDKYLEAL